MRTAESDEKKVIPSLTITEEPPNSLDIMEGDAVVITCRAESSHTENIGYSWEYANTDSVIQVLSGVGLSGSCNGTFRSLTRVILK